MAARKSPLDVMASGGQVEITLPDLFSILPCCKMPATCPGYPTRGECSYTFLGIQHDPLISVETTGILYAEGTMPEMSCSISVTAGAAAETDTVAGVTFTDIKAGDKIVIDGMNSRVLLNGGTQYPVRPGRVPQRSPPAKTPSWRLTALRLSITRPINKQEEPCCES